MRYVAILMMLSSLSGCASNMVIPSTKTIDSTGSIITETAATVGDVSSYRTKQKYDAWKTAYVEYTRAVQASGFRMEFAQFEIGGTTVIMPKTISFVERPNFTPPADLKDHPVWATVQRGIEVVTPWGFGTWLGGKIVSGFEHGMSEAGNTYQGPVAMSGSYNTSGRDQSVYSGPLAQDNATRQDGSYGQQIGEPSVDGGGLNACMVNPPAGYNQNGTPMMTSTQSCESFFGE